MGLEAKRRKKRLGEYLESRTLNNNNPKPMQMKLKLGFLATFGLAALVWSSLSNNSVMLDSLTTTTTTTEGKEELKISREIANDPIAVVEVAIWPELQSYASSSVHVYIDGITRSPFLKRSKNFNRFLPHDTTKPIETRWLGILYAGGINSYEKWCQKFGEKVKQAQDKCKRQGRSGCYWHIHIGQYSDKVERNKTCENVEELMTSAQDGIDGKDFVHYTQRAIVKGRGWNKTSQWIRVGTRLDHFTNVEPALPVTFSSIGDDGITSTGLHRYRHSGFPVRSDVVRTYETSIKDIFGGNFSFGDPIERLWNRSIDVAHFWPHNKIKDPNLYDGSGKFRGKVSQILHDHCKSSSNSNSNSTAPSCFVGLAGAAGENGRRTTKSAYVDTMLDSKIIVMSQRDPWEDHYRLMEGMISGAMIMTDVMLTLPAGYQDGASIVEYHSRDDLLAKIDYYLDPHHESERLAIAREGRKLALEQHCSWHLMEKTFFGRILTTPALMEDLDTTVADIARPGLKKKKNRG